MLDASSLRLDVEKKGNDHHMTTAVIDVNADLGESFGRWVLGRDNALVPLVSSINVACGFHAGDPNVMLASAKLAKQHGVGLGAHPGYPDLAGFGRRAMALDPDEIRNYCLYQVGALREIARYVGIELQHVKPHGSLYARICSDLDVAEGLAKALRCVNEEITLILLDNDVATVLIDKGFRVAREAFADLDYRDDGSIIIERIPGERDPAIVAQQAMSICDGFVHSVTGERITVTAETICIHGDRPNAVAIAMRLNDALDERGVTVSPVGMI